VSRLDLRDAAPELHVERGEHGEVTLEVHAGDMQVHITVGRYAQDADTLAAALRQAAEDASDLADGWEDLPDDSDAYIGFDRGRYHVSLDGSRVGDYPSQDVAEIELARAMTAGGVFPNAWFITDHGNPIPINDNLRRWHDENGTGMVAIPDVRFEPGQRIWYGHNDWPYRVVGDWGQAGVEIHAEGEPGIWTHVTDRDALRPNPT
jgi:hypothetical protein